jgi:hypothetical protein
MHVTYHRGSYTVSAKFADWITLLLDAISLPAFPTVLTEVHSLTNAARDHPDNADIETGCLRVAVSMSAEHWHSLVPLAIRCGLIGRGITVGTLPGKDEPIHRSFDCNWTCRSPYWRDSALAFNWRRNGEIRRWKRDESRFRLPIKHGMYGPYDHLDNTNAADFHYAADCPYGL